MATAKDYPASGYNLICFMGCLHDMGDPLGAAAHALQALKLDGTVLLIEPYAGDRVEDNLNAVGRLYYAASPAICTPCSCSQEVGLGLGAQADEAHLWEIMMAISFSRYRCATQTPFIWCWRRGLKSSAGWRPDSFGIRATSDSGLAGALHAAQPAFSRNSVQTG